MSAPPDGYRFPYTPTPGASMPPPPTTPAEGVADMWGYFWLAIVSTAIIAVTGLVAWSYVHTGI